ncbi:MAG: hypothetical protein AAGI52_17515 [Bacteroidota bacterium]
MTRLLIVFLALAPLAACSSDESPDDPTGTNTEAGAEGFGGPLEGDVLEVATSSGDEIEVGVTDAVLYLRLSDATRKEAAEEMDREVPEDGLGGTIGRAVTSFVNEALQTTVQLPLEDVEALRYENGRLVIEAKDNTTTVRIGDDQADGIPFDEADAQRLIDAFESAR